MRTNVGLRSQSLTDWLRPPYSRFICCTLVASSSMRVVAKYEGADRGGACQNAWASQFIQVCACL
jgi:hypothetical protein